MAFKYAFFDRPSKSDHYVVEGQTASAGVKIRVVDTTARDRALRAANKKLKTIVSEIKHESDTQHEQHYRIVAGE